MAMEATHAPLVPRTWRMLGSFSRLARKFPSKSIIWRLAGGRGSRKWLEFN
ncbi:hypothetical protein P3S68_014065 [Capsicum galapagoense]